MMKSNNKINGHKTRFPGSLPTVVGCLARTLAKQCRITLRDLGKRSEGLRKGTVGSLIGTEKRPLTVVLMSVNPVVAATAATAGTSSCCATALAVGTRPWGAGPVAADDPVVAAMGGFLFY